MFLILLATFLAGEPESSDTILVPLCFLVGHNWSNWVVVFKSCRTQVFRGSGVLDSI